MEDSNEKVKSSSKKRSRKPKALEYVGWGSRNLIEFLESLGRDTTNKISEYDVTAIVRNYIREINRENPSKKKKKMVACDDKLRMLFGIQRINILKVPDLVEKHYVEYQEDADYDYIFGPEDDDKQPRLSSSDKVTKQTNQVVPKPKGTFAAIVSDNIKLLYLRKTLLQELAKTPETFESKVVGTFVRIKNPCQLVQVTGVKEGNLLDGYLLQVTNYSYYLKDVTVSVLSDDDFSQDECEELHQRIKNGCAKRLKVGEMEKKVRSLHEDVTKHWLARELVLLQRRINQANEKGWRRELSEYLEKRELLSNPEEQSRLLREVPEVVAEELEPECVDDDDDDDDGKIENDFIVPVPNPEASVKTYQSNKEHHLSDSPDSSIQKTFESSKLRDGTIENEFIVPNPEVSVEAYQSDEEHQLSDPPDSSIQTNLENSKLRDVEDQPTWNASAGDNSLNDDVLEPPANDITQNKDSFTEAEVEITKATPVIDLVNKPQAQSHPVEIIELSDDEEEKDNRDYEQYDPKKVMWLYEYPKGKTQGPFSLTALKVWNDEEYFVEVTDFKVWKTGESKKSAVLLTKLVEQVEKR